MMAKPIDGQPPQDVSKDVEVRVLRAISYGGVSHPKGSACTLPSDVAGAFGADYVQILPPPEKAMGSPATKPFEAPRTK